MSTDRCESIDSVVKAELHTTDWINDEITDMSPFDLPISSFLGVESQKALQNHSIELSNRRKKIEESMPSIEDAPIDEIPLIRKRQAEIFYNSETYVSLINRYAVSVQSQIIAGVYTEVFTPNEDIEYSNRERVLINLHGGGFISGGRTASHLESIPIAAVGKIKIVSVDYRMAPEHQYPAASDDVIAVYKTLLQDYRPENIGIFGCSAGALLTSQIIARLQQEDIPLPQAIGMSCAAAYFWSEGDSGHIVSAIADFPIERAHNNPYFKDINRDDSLAFPGKSKEVLEKFPPSLLISSTRDFSLSSVAHTHSQLIKLGVKADLHIWEGLEHAFIYNSDLPESREAYRVIANFFNENLGSP